MSRFRRRLLSQDNDFEELEYIDSDGNQYINTEIKLNESYKYTAKYIALKNNNDYSCVFGAENIDKNHRILLTNLNFAWADYTSSPGSPISYTLDNNDYTITDKKVINNITKEEFTFDYNESIDNTLNIYLFALNRANTSIRLNLGGIRMQNFYIKNSLENYIINLIPVRKKSSGTVCMYDKVTKKFFYNQGAGSFIAGPVKSNTMITDGLIDEWINPSKTVEDSKWIGTINGNELELCGNACVENDKVELKDNEASDKNSAKSWLSPINTYTVKTIIIKFKYNSNIGKDFILIDNGNMRWSSRSDGWGKTPDTLFLNNNKISTYSEQSFNTNNIASNSVSLAGTDFFNIGRSRGTGNCYGAPISIEAIYLYDRVLTPEEHSQMYHYINDEKPYAYETEYLESNGTQYIDTNINLVNTNKINIKCQSSYNKNTTYFGCRTINPTNEISLIKDINSGNFFHIGNGNGGRTMKFNFDNILKSDSILNVGINNIESSINDVNIKHDGDLPNLPLYLFGMCIYDYSTYSITKPMLGVCKIYYSKIFDSDTLQQYLIPVITKTGEACMYDKVSRKLFKNQGTGSFIAPRSNTKAVNRAIGTQDSFSFVPNNTVNQYIDIYKINKSVFSVNNYVSVFFTLKFENCEFNDNCYVRDVISNLNFSSVIGGIGKIQNGIFNYFGTKLITDNLYKPDRDNNFGLRCDYIGGENAKITISNLTVVQGDTPLLEWKPAPEDTPRPNLLRQSGNFLKMPEITWWNNAGGGVILDYKNTYNNYPSLQTSDFGTGNGINSCIYNIIPNTIYTLSYLVNAENSFNGIFESGKEMPVHVQSISLDNNKHNEVTISSNLIYDTPNDWKQLSYTFNSGNGNQLRCYVLLNSLTKKLNIANMKLELGSNATSWIPNELDVPNTSNIIFRKYSKNNPKIHTDSKIDGNKYIDRIFLKPGTYKCTFKTDGNLSNHVTSNPNSPEDKKCNVWILNMLFFKDEGKAQNNVCSGLKNPFTITVTDENSGTYHLRTNTYSDGETPVTVNFWDIVIEKTA